jgi:energy-coupling factor transport system permease protein
MDSRGFGRHGTRSPSSRRFSGALLVVGLGGVCAGLYGLLDGTAPRLLGVPALVAGAVVAVTGLAVSARGMQRSVYRPDRWRGAEILVVLCGILAAAAVYASAAIDPANLYPSLYPLAWPEVALLPVAGLLVAALPAWLAPPPPATAGHPSPSRATAEPVPVGGAR